MLKRLFNLKSNKGVTLVPLIITIIVLLILAGVTINAVVGGEGTVEKAGEAKNNTESINNKTIVENAVAIAMGKEQGKTLHLDTLTSAVGNVGTVAQEGQYFTVTIQNYKYWVSEDGDVLFEKPESTALLLNSKIFKQVDYSVTCKDKSNNDVVIDKWRIFYADEENNEVFIITENIVELNTRIYTSTTGGGATNYAQGAASDAFAQGTYGRKYNKKWFEVEGMPDAAKTNGNVNNNAKIAAYLCDSTNANWIKYANGTFGTGIKAKTAKSLGAYAVGGPTIELLQASVREYDSTKLDGDFIVTALGYNSPFLQLDEPYKAKYNESKYGYWWLASPSITNIDGDRGCDVYHNGRVCGGGVATSANYYNNTVNLGVRPLVSIPLDKFQMSWIKE